MLFKWADTIKYLTRPYWRYLYAKQVRPGVAISLEEFRKLKQLIWAVERQELRREYARRIRLLPIRILNVVVDLSESRAIEDYRLHLAREFTLFMYRQYLETNTEYDGEPYIIHLAELDVIGGNAIAQISYSVGKKKNVQKDIKVILNYYFKVPKREINIKKVGKGELKVVFPVGQKN